MSRRRWLLLAAAGLAALLAAPFGGRALLWRWETNPVLRGRQLAAEQGCLGCHLPFAGVEIPNPGSRWGTVPAFRTGNSFMYAQDTADLADFIRHGSPASWREDAASRERLATQRLRMPAFGERLSPRQISDLVAYVRAQDGFELAGGEAAQGREVARRLGCPSCHGAEGAGGLPNPGSIAGFIPGFLGKNFTDLVESEDEFAEWVRTGTSRRLASQPLVSYFWRRQTLAMPAYGDAVSDSEMRSLWLWVRAARRTFGSAQVEEVPP